MDGVVTCRWCRLHILFIFNGWCRPCFTLVYTLFTDGVVRFGINLFVDGVAPFLILCQRMVSSVLSLIYGRCRPFSWRLIHIGNSFKKIICFDMGIYVQVVPCFNMICLVDTCFFVVIHFFNSRFTLVSIISLDYSSLVILYTCIENGNLNSRCAWIRRLLCFNGISIFCTCGFLNRFKCVDHRSAAK